MQLLSKKTNWIYLFIGILALLQMLYIWKFSIDIPYSDEWELFRSYSFMMNPSWESLFIQHNEHKIVIPKLVFSLYYYILNFNIPIGLIINFLVFSSAVLMLIRYLYNGKNNLFFAVFSLMLFSPLNFENLLWVFQIQWHLFLIFLILSCHYLSNNSSDKVSTIWYIVLPPAMIFCLGSGLAASLTFILLILLKLVILKDRKNILPQIIFALSSGLSLILYFSNYVKPASHPSYTFPYQFAFWDHFNALISIGAGNRDHAFKLIGFLFLIFHSIGTFQILKNWNQSSTQKKFLFFFSITLLAVLASISVSRAGLGTDQAFSSRYFEYSSFYLVSVIAMNFEMLERLKYRYSLCILVLLTAFTLPNFHMRDYKSMHDQRERGLKCLIENIKINTNNTCAEIYHVGPISDIVRELKSKNLKISFLKYFEN